MNLIERLKSPDVTIRKIITEILVVSLPTREIGFNIIQTYMGLETSTRNNLWPFTIEVPIYARAFSDLHSQKLYHFSCI